LVNKQKTAKEPKPTTTLAKQINIVYSKQYALKKNGSKQYQIREQDTFTKLKNL